jgi:cell division protein FtsB
MEPKRKLLILGIAGGALFLFGPPLVRLIELKAEQAAIQARIAHLKTENQRLIEEARRLRDDPAYLEAVARRELGFARPGETVVKFSKRNEQDKVKGR